GAVARHLARQRAEAGQIDAVLTQRRHGWQPLLLADLEVLLAAARRDVDDARALGGPHQVPRHHPVRLAGGLGRPPSLPAAPPRPLRRVAARGVLRLQLVEGPLVGPAAHVGPLPRAQLAVALAGLLLEVLLDRPQPRPPGRPRRLLPPAAHLV